jgi:hypothetical protein
MPPFRHLALLTRLHFFSPGSGDTAVLQVPAARCACLLAPVARLGAFFNPQRRKNLRLYLTAGVSVADVGSDVFSVSVNYRAGNTGLASALLATVLLSMSFQILIVVVVHRHHGKQRLMLEILFVVTGVKPFVDVWRILNGKVNVGAPMDTKAERAGCKTVEIVIESVPTALIQMHEFVGATKLSFSTVFSIVMSCLSIATITTGMFFDYDTDPANRLRVPMFYGAVPDSTMRKLLVRVTMRAMPASRHASSRFVFVQASLFLFVLAHAMGKLTAIPLLLKTSPAALPAYLCGAMALYVLYKLTRRDFQYWVPTAGAGLSLVCRVFGKLYVDFSGNPQFRHPFEIGGAAYLLMLCETQGAFVASTIAYSRLYAGDDKIDDAPLFTALAVLVGTWAVALVTFLLSINRTHLITFFSTETGAQFTCRRFDHFAGNDEQRMVMFANHPSLWAPFADVVQAWVAQQYPTMSAQPWFTPEVKALIPSAFLPPVPLP